MKRYSENMVMKDLVDELVRIDATEGNEDLDNLGKKILFVTNMVVCPSVIPEIE